MPVAAATWSLWLGTHLFTFAAWGAWLEIAAFVVLCLTRADLTGLVRELDGSSGHASRLPLLVSTVVIVGRHLLIVLADPGQIKAPFTATEMSVLGGSSLAYLADKGAVLNGNAPPLASILSYFLGQRSSS